MRQVNSLANGANANRRQTSTQVKDKKIFAISLPDKAANFNKTIQITNAIDRPPAIKIAAP
jgi:hypothetical protein